MAKGAGTQDRLTEVKLRFPAPNQELGIPDYLAIIKDRAKAHGFETNKGITKGEGNVNEYILHLIEADINGHLVLEDFADNGFRFIRQKDLPRKNAKKEK